jgi:hypothetical protein
MRFRLLLLPIVVLACATLAQARTGNPYCVSGANWSANGTMNKLGMPAESWAYIWDQLQTTNVANMVRPCRYWLYVGANHRYWGYHEDTDTIDDPAQFQTWVLANPGKIWIIGNEPDLISQDGITQEQYARMFKTYYDFIKPLDPTARFAIGAVASDNDPAGLARAEGWYQAALDSYQAQFGAIMPVDVWNCHCYASPARADANKTMDDWINPFCAWVKTIEGGAYADCEIWITEFGIALWGGDLSMANANTYMYDLCRLLEASPVDKWFWFLGPYESPWGNICLLTAAGQPSLLGQSYAALANSYPNGAYTVPPKPALPDPPRVFKDDFDDGDVADWTVKAGDWAVDSGALRQTTVNAPFWGQHIYPSYLWTDGTFAVDVKINAAADPQNWAGFLIRASGPWDSSGNSGYLVYLRQNGELGVYTGADGQVVTVAGAVADTGVFHRLSAEIAEYTIKVYVDGSLKATWTDPNQRFSYGYFSLQSGKTDCSFDNVRVDTFDPRFALVATDGGGSEQYTPMQGTQFFSPLRAGWWYNYLPTNIDTKWWGGYQRLFMFWRATMTAYTDQQLQDMARQAKAKDPRRTIVWAMSNEPNDLGQANQSATAFADIYYKHLRNLKLGDPTCMVIGPGILNWDFQSTSVFQTGKSWYEEFRNAWYNNPTYRAYSEANYGVSYPPQDAFNLHAYDLRGVQGTPYEPESWTYCRDEILACHADLETYPETQGKQIWLTEFGGLRSPTMTVAADRAAGLVLWMREQPFMERWFWFIIHSDQYGTWANLELLDDNAQLTPYGMVFRDFSLLTDEDRFINWPYHHAYDDCPPYARAGWPTSAGISESTDAGLNLYLNSGQSYAASTMKGVTFDGSPYLLGKVTFNSATNYDNSKVTLVMDTPTATNVWQENTAGATTTYQSISLRGYNASSVNFGLIVKQSFTYGNPTGDWHGTLANVTLYAAPGTAVSPAGWLRGPGWNLVSLPYEPADPDWRKAFGDLPIHQRLFRYDPVTQSYIVYDENDPQAFGTLTNGDGCWLYLDAPANVSYPGLQPGGTRQINLGPAGWHLVGAPLIAAAALGRVSVKDLVTGQRISFYEAAYVRGWIGRSLFSYDPLTRGYRTVGYDPWDSAVQLSPWRGYWLCTHVDDLALVIL